MKTVSLLLLALSLWACGPDSLSDDDYKIINATFPHLVLPALPGIEREFGYDNYIFPADLLAETELRDVYFIQYLVNPADSIFHGDLSLNESYLTQLKDAEFKLLGKAFSKQTNPSTRLDIDLIKNIGINKLIPIEINQLIRRDIGTSAVTYSSIVYNEAKDKACFYFQDNCSGLCAYAKWVFVEKIDGIWTIKQQLSHWVS